MNPDAPSTLPDARPYIDALLARAIDAAASDIHIEPTASGAAVKLRIDGLLQTVDSLAPDLGRGSVLRLMVLAQLLTYRLDIPQEGRITWQPPPLAPQDSSLKPHASIDLRLAIMPTAHGLRAVVRLPADLHQPKTLANLGLPPRALEALQRFARTDAGGAGMLLVTGPAGSGKTTTIYALLEHIAAISPGLSIIALEDPVERLIPGVTQIEVTPHGQLTYERALKSILRQDPQVLMLGEIRDLATASIAIQAALSGHRLIATLHAGQPATALARLLEMGIEPYQITSSLFGILTQRLVRKLQNRTRSVSEGRQSASQNKPASVREEPDCQQQPSDHGPLTADHCYSGRTPIAEFAELNPAVRAAILRRADAQEMRNIFGQQPGHATIRQVATSLVAQNLTDAAEIQRVLGDE